jgi:hypothetical protein
VAVINRWLAAIDYLHAPKGHRFPPPSDRGHEFGASASGKFRSERLISMRHRVRSVGDGRICSVRDLRIGSWSEAVVGAGAGRALSVGGCVRFPTREYSPGPLGEAGRRRDQRNRRDPRSRRASADESGDGPGFLAHGQSLSSGRRGVFHAGWMGCSRLAGSQSSIRHARYNAIATPGRRTSRTVNREILSSR